MLHELKLHKLSWHFRKTQSFWIQKRVPLACTCGEKAAARFNIQRKHRKTLTDHILTLLKSKEFFCGFWLRAACQHERSEDWKTLSFGMCHPHATHHLTIWVGFHQNVAQQAQAQHTQFPKSSHGRLSRRIEKWPRPQDAKTQSTVKHLQRFFCEPCLNCFTTSYWTWFCILTVRFCQVLSPVPLKATSATPQQAIPVGKRGWVRSGRVGSHVDSCWVELVTRSSWIAAAITCMAWSSDVCSKKLKDWVAEHPIRMK